MMASLPIAFDTFTFIDLGSGKGRTLLMAFGVSVSQNCGRGDPSELDRAAQENIQAYKKPNPAMLRNSGSVRRCARLRTA